MPGDLAITRLDDGPPRPDLDTRRELKFVFTGHDVATLRRQLLQTCRPIFHAGPVSTVRSVYFDDPVLGNCRANLDGIGLRHKTRLRWYDRRTPADRFYLEVKWRRHRVCGKHRVHLGSNRPPGESSFRQLHSTLRRHLPEPYHSCLASDTEPVVLVEYRREHFARRDGTARLTLDYDLRFFPQLGHRRINHRFAESLPGVVLIEWKSGAAHVHSIPSTLKPLRVRATRFSKYAIGCQRLGYVSPQ